MAESTLGHNSTAFWNTLVERLKKSWSFSDHLFSWIEPDAWIEKPIPLRHPFLFYFGHLPAFAYNQVGRGLLEKTPFHPQFDDLFEFGIDPLDEDAARKASIHQWPTLDEIHQYRDGVRKKLLAMVEEVAGRSRDDRLVDQGRIYQLVIEHELMHHETLVYMFQLLGLEYKAKPDSCPEPLFGKGADLVTLSIPGGEVTVGRDFDEIPYGWDNEFPSATVPVDPFQIDSVPVTMGRFAEFIETGGYGDKQWWREEDWNWRDQANIEHPPGWSRRGETWQYQTMFETVDLDQVAWWPVMVSYGEALAYCRWKGGRLPTEGEWLRMAYGSDQGERTYPWGDDEPTEKHGNFGWTHYSPTPVGHFPDGAGHWGALDVLGNGWEWTSTVFGPLDKENFTPYRTYPGYSANFFDHRHYVVRGGSWASHHEFLRPSFRNWFHDHYPYAFTTFRCAYDD